MRTPAIPKTAEPWSLTSLREKLIKISAMVVSHGRYTTLQMAEVTVPRQRFQEILMLIAQLRVPHREMRSDATADDDRGTPDQHKAASFGPAGPSILPF